MCPDIAIPPHMLDVRSIDNSESATLWNTLSDIRWLYTFLYAKKILLRAQSFGTHQEGMFSEVEIQVLEDVPKLTAQSQGGQSGKLADV